ncbi:MAG TPA: hypothetical protein PKL56_13955 [Cyclobacteriaceae bacterium]|nr:hypothetical protein [Cyclobacteriaceae bacterium]HMV07607.1 hypothetical protein [Cyclobacteriaceae bacterium]HMV89336.1 hypothetical protein [Cyclobacteriaceae bacterium]HMW98742.1 hypothetical protein [Cyclobacteriaceae bacterium]HMX48625.1 hypothetical protein [Cyclobacteriaceae bacterium]
MNSRNFLSNAFVCLVAVSCTDQVDVSPTQKSSAAVEATSLKKEPELEHVLDLAGFTQPIGGATARLNGEGAGIDVDRILKIVQEDSVHHTYTFKIQDDEPRRFSNLVIEETSRASYLVFILTYEFEGKFTDMNHFSGKVSRFDLYGNPLRELDFLDGELILETNHARAKGSMTTDCLTGVDKREECLEWRKSNALGDQETCAKKVLILTMKYGDCSSYDPGTPSDGTNNQPYGGGTTISGPGTSSSSPSPAENVDGSNPVKPIPGYKPKKSVAVIPDEWPGSDEGLPYQWWLDDQWLDENFSLSPDDEDYNKLTAEERRLINQYPIQAYAISKNALKASAETKARFGNDGLNDKSDAFRHCFFNAMNQRDCGKDPNLNSIAKKFGDAHESETPAALDLERQMDLYNNAIGHIIGDVMFPAFTSDKSLAEEAMTRVTNGGLRYLSPLDHVASKRYDSNRDGIQDCPTCRNGITSATQLTPTNQ